MTRPAPQREDLLALRRAVDAETRIQLDALTQPAVAELVGDPGGRPTGHRAAAAGRRRGGQPALPHRAARRARPLRRHRRHPVGHRAARRRLGARLAARRHRRPARLSSPRPPGRCCGRPRCSASSSRVTDLTTVLGKTVADLVPALDEARASGVLTDAGGGIGLAFRHPLIREALYAELPAAVRSAWHRDAGHALAAAGAAPDRVARQLLRSIGEPGRRRARLSRRLVRAAGGSPVPQIVGASRHSWHDHRD